MKRFLFPVLFLLLFLAGCAHSRSGVSYTGPTAPSLQQQVIPIAFTPDDIFSVSHEIIVEDESADTKVEANPDEASKNAGSDLEGEEGEEETVSIADPIEPFNRAMFHFNDKLYFWVMKPVAQGYGKVVPEEARSGVKRFFSNLAFPIRFVSCLLQADFGGAATETGRFVVNTLWGIGGLLDPASTRELDLQKQDADLGQTLGVYGLGQGFYIVWPVIGPSSLRDSVGVAGDFFLYPVSYITPWYSWLGVRGYEEINDTSLRIGDYEALKEAAIDPYVALKNAYAQYRQNKVKQRGKKEPVKPGGVRLGAAKQ